MGLDSRWIELPSVHRRLLLFSVTAAALFCLLLLRLWYLQIINTEDYQERSVRNRTRVLPLEAPRGPIFDRNGRLLVGNRPAFGISVMRQDVENPQALLALLAQLLDINATTLEKRWQQGKGLPIYRPVVLAEDVPRQFAERVLEHNTDLPGVLVSVRPVREYLEKGSIAHVTGYLGEVTEAELSQDRGKNLQTGDVIGKVALEKTYENFLRGTKGLRRVEVDVRGKLLRPLEIEAPQPGQRVFLTIQQELQQAANLAFGDNSGALVAMDVRTGEVLAMLSRPTYDPSLFARGIESQAWTELLRDPRHPLQNKAISGLYAPASTFKMMVALAALREDSGARRRVVDCDGSFELGEARFRCWKKDGHGRTDMIKALRESCDLWFYQVGLDLGIDKIAAIAREFGLGEVVGFPLAGENAGVVPSRAWKRQRFQAPWYGGETVIAAIGQGYVLVTPLQLAVMTAALANQGTLLKPQIVKRVEDWQGKVLQQTTPQILHQIEMPAAAWQTINDGLVAAVNEPHGTGSASRMAEVVVAGKTGTSQVVRRKSEEEEENQAGEEVPYEFRPHALFVAYAPADKPQIAVAIVVEHGRHGGGTAGPMAKAVFEAYFKAQSTDFTTLVLMEKEESD
ncbi:MAG: penicillin-binding protein 2 [Deltaproteobacteria bacterium]|nr:penicillin-binding protein 2 [Deltaproteobacteria bacterium]